jgi:hypothetical protein
LKPKCKSYIRNKKTEKEKEEKKKRRKNMKRAEGEPNRPSRQSSPGPIPFRPKRVSAPAPHFADTPDPPVSFDEDLSMEYDDSTCLS